MRTQGTHTAHLGCKLALVGGRQCAQLSLGRAAALRHLLAAPLPHRRIAQPAGLRHGSHSTSIASACAESRCGCGQSGPISAARRIDTASTVALTLLPASSLQLSPQPRLLPLQCSHPLAQRGCLSGAVDQLRLQPRARALAHRGQRQCSVHGRGERVVGLRRNKRVNFFAQCQQLRRLDGFSGLPVSMLNKA